MNKRKGIRFRPALLPTLAVLFLVPSLAALGFWQLDRMAHKQALERQFEAGEATVLNLNEVTREPLRRYQRVAVTGRYVPEEQFLLDNMTHAGRAGVHVLSVFEVSGREERLLVNRGWVPLGADRARLPAPPLPAGDLRIGGQLDRLPRPGLELGDDVVPAAQGWPRLVVFPTVEELSAQLSHALFPQVLLLDPSVPGGFVRDWRPVHFPPEKHLAYAVQWFALSAAVLVIYIVVNIRRPTS